VVELVDTSRLKIGMASNRYADSFFKIIGTTQAIDICPGGGIGRHVPIENRDG
jgi:hypothetical protein